MVKTRTNEKQVEVDRISWQGELRVNGEFYRQWNTVSLLMSIDVSYNSGKLPSIQVDSSYLEAADVYTFMGNLNVRNHTEHVCKNVENILDKVAVTYEYFNSVTFRRKKETR